MAVGALKQLPSERTDPPSARPLVLVASPRNALRRTVAQAVGRVGFVRTASDLATVEQLAAEVQADGAIIDQSLDPSLDLLRRIRLPRDPRVLLVISPTRDPREASRICGAGASFASGREDDDTLAQRAIAVARAAAMRRGRLDALVAELSSRYRLTPACSELLATFTAGEERDGLGPALGIAETSVRSRVRHTCRALEIPRLERVYRLLLGEAIGTGSCH